MEKKESVLKMLRDEMFGIHSASTLKIMAWKIEQDKNLKYTEETVRDTFNGIASTTLKEMTLLQATDQVKREAIDTLYKEQHELLKAVFVRD